jgi:hypothetical protein
MRHEGPVGEAAPGRKAGLVAFVGLQVPRSGEPIGFIRWNREVG